MKPDNIESLSDTDRIRLGGNLENVWKTLEGIFGESDRVFDMACFWYYLKPEDGRDLIEEFYDYESYQSYQEPLETDFLTESAQKDL